MCGPALTSLACFDLTVSILSENLQARFFMQRLLVIRCACSLSAPNGADPSRRDVDIASELFDTDIHGHHEFLKQKLSRMDGVK